MLPKHISEQLIKYHFTDEAVAARPTSWELALHTGDPGTGDANEVADSAYTRMPITLSASDEGAYWDGVSDSTVSFPPAGAGAAYSVTHFTIRDAGSGEAMAASPLPVPIPVVEGGVISFAAGDIIVRGV